MIKQTVICDICKEEINPQDSAWLKLLIQHNGIAYSGMLMVPNEMHVHLKCWTEGILGRYDLLHRVYPGDR